MSQKVLILGATGQVATLFTQRLLTETDASLVIYGRNVSERINITNPDREITIDGDFNDTTTLTKALKGVDIVYLNSMSSVSDTQNVINVLKANHVKRIIGVTIVGIYNEFSKQLGDWTKRNLSSSYQIAEQQSAALLENSGLDYTLLRLTWLYNDPNNTNYQLIPRGTIVTQAQVTRQAVAEAIVNVINHEQDYRNQSLAVVEPNTDYGKPSFY